MTEHDSADGSDGRASIGIGGPRGSSEQGEGPSPISLPEPPALSPDLARRIESGDATLADLLGIPEEYLAQPGCDDSVVSPRIQSLQERIVRLETQNASFKRFREELPRYREALESLASIGRGPESATRLREVVRAQRKSRSLALLVSDAKAYLRDLHLEWAEHLKMVEFAASLGLTEDDVELAYQKASDGKPFSREPRPDSPPSGSAAPSGGPATASPRIASPVAQVIPVAQPATSRLAELLRSSNEQPSPLVAVASPPPSVPSSHVEPPTNFPTVRAAAPPASKSSPAPWIAVGAVCLIAAVAVGVFATARSGGAETTSVARRSSDDGTSTHEVRDTAIATAAAADIRTAPASTSTSTVAEIPGASPVLPGTNKTPAGAVDGSGTSNRPGAVDSPPLLGAITSLKPQSVSASSFIQGREHHPPEHAFDGKLKTAWNEGVPGPGRGEWLEADLGSPNRIVAVKLSTGFDWTTKAGEDLFSFNAHIKAFRILFDGGNAVSRDVDATTHEVTVGGLDITARRIRIVIDDVWEGQRWQDMCISEVTITGAPLHAR